MMMRLFSVAVPKLNALVLIALCAVFMPAIAQNSPQNTSQRADEAAEHNAERARITRERAELKQTLEKNRQACYQKLAVTPCLNDARDANNEKMRDLKRQEVALNDLQRKRAAADRMRAIDEKNSPQAQQALAERRGKALQATERREQSRLQRENSRQAKQSAAEAASSDKPSQSSPKAAPAPQGKPRAEPKEKAAKEVDAAKVQRHREQAAQREKEAAERRANAQEREAKRKKPAAKPLPVPPS
jgi:colicin import membrane protein